jgi:hypothetical protein
MASGGEHWQSDLDKIFVMTRAHALSLIRLNHRWCHGWLVLP